MNQVFGMTTGMALLPITFDWSQISGFLGSPLTTPWFAAGNIVVGLVLWIWIICPILHFTNVWEGLYFPFSSYIPVFTELMIDLLLMTIPDSFITWFVLRVLLILGIKDSYTECHFG